MFLLSMPSHVSQVGSKFETLQPDRHQRNKEYRAKIKQMHCLHLIRNGTPLHDISRDLAHFQDRQRLAWLKP